MPKKKLVIKKEDLEKVKETANAFYDNTDEEEEDETYVQWKNACVKAFPIDYYETEWDVLKSIGVAIRNKPISVWVKVYQALGYKVEQENAHES